ncbi:MAG: hypothetical protein CL766_04755 [Chloroflexi bacterium]|nr:hypothetical protein [Chloroflexota bacterium]|tara:strand:+ start:2378 stop:3067 length:690 start_codon:yes stop_codon:yes gene_type:complete
MQFFKNLKNFSRDNSGVTGLETAIILIAFVVVAAVFAFTVMTTGLFSTEKAKTTAQAALTEASSSFIIKGPVLAKCSPGVVPIDCEVDANPIGKAEEFISRISFTIALSSGADQQTLDESELAFIYSDENNIFTTPGLVPARKGIITAISIVEIVSGKTIGVLEDGDTALVTVNLNRNTTKGLGMKPVDDVIHLGPNTNFRIEMISPKGGTLIISRTTPEIITKNMNLQ